MLPVPIVLQPYSPTVQCSLRLRTQTWPALCDLKASHTPLSHPIKTACCSGPVFAAALSRARASAAHEGAPPPASYEALPGDCALSDATALANASNVTTLQECQLACNVCSQLHAGHRSHREWCRGVSFGTSDGRALCFLKVTAWTEADVLPAHRGSYPFRYYRRVAQESRERERESEPLLAAGAVPAAALPVPKRLRTRANGHASTSAVIALAAPSAIAVFVIAFLIIVLQFICYMYACSMPPRI